MPISSHTENSGKAAARSRRARGFTLIEVLVALVVLSIGLLGLASLQASAKRSSHQAHQRMLATQLVDGMIEQIRANPEAAASYHTGVATPLGAESLGNTPPSPDCSSGAACTAAELAAFDLWSWEQSIDGAAITNADNTRAGGLIVPGGCVVFTADAGKTNTGQLSVILSWQGLTEISDAADGTTAICGGGAANTNNRRRQTVVNTYIIDESE